MSDQEINKADQIPLLHVYAAVAAVMDEVQGIAKAGTGPKDQGGYAFRKADDVVNDLGAAFRRHKLFLQSRVIETDHTQHETIATGRTDRNHNPLPDRTVVWSRRLVVMEYRVTSLVDGSELVVQSTGEGLDQSDKASNKAMTAALKYALTQGFMIATDAQQDGDAEAPMLETAAARAVRERRAQEAAAQQPPAAAPAPASAPVADPPAEAPAAAPAQPDARIANAERDATRALTEAAKQSVQAQERGDAPVFEPEQLERARKAHQAATIGDRFTINRVILAAKAEGLMHAQIGGTPLHALLTTLREVAPNG